MGSGRSRAFRRRGRGRALVTLLVSAWRSRGSSRLLLVVALLVLLAVMAKAAGVAVSSLLYSGL
jgi:hypothetical protein